ncbi:MAG TPA: glycosyl hydrolase [Phnomibacter sp.]|nr:glycosyl hydrolase [Phnomibacter sp.]
MFRISSISSLLFLLLCVCGVTSVAQQVALTDKKATKETVQLYRNLQKLRAKGFLFGHQDDLAYGVNWKYVPGNSDIKQVVGDYPALYGWELGGIEVPGQKHNLDSVPFTNMKQYIEEGYKRGGVISLSWHAQSPFGKPGGAWDTTHGSVASVLPGGANHTKYLQWLDKVAAFIASLKGSKNEAVPILFRPFHELTGTWFWWCQNACTVDEYKALWKFTRSYLQEQKQLHNLIWVYNTGGDFTTEADYMERYPGDEQVDVLTFDTYQYGSVADGKNFATNTNKRLGLVGEIATKHNKLFAIGETGFEQVPDAKWWTEVLLPAIGNNKISWVLLWRNHGYHTEMKKLHYYAPYKGQVSAPDFLDFYKLSNTIFEKEAKKGKLYK